MNPHGYWVDSLNATSSLEFTHFHDAYNYAKSLNDPSFVIYKGNKSVFVWTSHKS